MDEDQAMERFDMENEDDGEFCYVKRKGKRHQSKDSDPEGRSRKNKRRKDFSKRQDFAKPLNFVSEGVVMPTGEIGQNSREKNEKINQVDEEDDGSMPGVGFGALGSAHSCFELGSGSKNVNRAKEKVNETSDDFLPTAFCKSIKEGALQRQRREKMEKRKLNKNTGGGIGEELLKKMGYIGGGLGKNAQGIVVPIEAKLRPKNMGLGFNEYKEAVNFPILQESFSQNKGLPQLVFESKLKEKLWSKHGRSKAKKKRDYVTAEELLVQKEEQGLHVVQKVFDMRGSQVRVLTNLETLNAEENSWENDVPMPELLYNLRLFYDLAELDIQKIDTDLRNERETVVTLQKEKEQVKHDAGRQRKQLDTMEEIDNEVEQLGNKIQMGTLTLDSLAKSFGNLQKRFPDEYKLGSLSTTACSFALPLFFREFQGWDPLTNPESHLNVVSVWKDLLQGDEIFDSPYTQLFMDVVFPAVRISITNTWQAQEPEPLLKFLDLWEQLVPHQALETILDNIVMPKLLAAVNSWDREHSAIHKWVHPWLPLLGKKLDTFYPIIRNRLESVLRVWHPSDVSVYTILLPWKPVFDSGSWEKIMVRFIVPKLLAVMHEFQVKPADQKLDHFYWFLTWVSVIPAHYMLYIMNGFFKKWLEVLYQLLCSKPDFQEAYNWFVGWRDLIPAELSSNEHIQAQLITGLGMMNQAAEGIDVVRPGLRENISYLKARELKQFQAAEKAGKVDDHVGGGVVDLSFKEVIELHAQKNNLLFKPKPGRMQNGHQLYGFGNISIFLDSLNEKVFALTEDRWSLVSLEQLLKLQKNMKH